MTKHFIALLLLALTVPGQESVGAVFDFIKGTYKGEKLFDMSPRDVTQALGQPEKSLKDGTIAYPSKGLVFEFDKDANKVDTITVSLKRHSPFFLSGTLETPVLEKFVASINMEVDSTWDKTKLMRSLATFKPEDQLETSNSIFLMKMVVEQKTKTWSAINSKAGGVGTFISPRDRRDIVRLALKQNKLFEKIEGIVRIVNIKLDTHIASFTYGTYDGKIYSIRLFKPNPEKKADQKDKRPKEKLDRNVINKWFNKSGKTTLFKIKDSEYREINTWTLDADASRGNPRYTFNFEKFRAVHKDFKRWSFPFGDNEVGELYDLIQKYHHWVSVSKKAGLSYGVKKKLGKVGGKDLTFVVGSNEIEFGFLKSLEEEDIELLSYWLSLLEIKKHEIAVMYKERDERQKKKDADQKKAADLLKD